MSELEVLRAEHRVLSARLDELTAERKAAFLEGHRVATLRTTDMVIELLEINHAPYPYGQSDIDAATEEYEKWVTK